MDDFGVDSLKVETQHLAQQLVARLRGERLTLATVESCTGGLVAAALTSIAGSSQVFGFGFVTYANEAKVSLVGVARELLVDYGAVSAEVATAMAEGGLLRSGNSLCLAITGIAGPDGGTVAKPVGLVYFALASQSRAQSHTQSRAESRATIIRREIFSGDRSSIRQQALNYGLKLVGDEGFEPPTPSV